MIDLIPPQFRLLAAVIAVACVASLAAAGGAQVATWKAEAACAESKKVLDGKIAELNAHIAELNNGIATANAEVLKAKGKSDAIEAAQAVAAKLAEEKLKASEQRLERLNKQFANATTCGEVLTDYWIERK